MKSKNKTLSVLLFIFFILVVIVTMLPLILLLVSSFRPGSDLMRFGLNFDKQSAYHDNSGRTCAVFKRLCRIRICDV